MANIGSLVADLKLNSASFIRDMGRAQAAIASTSAQTAKHTRAMSQSFRNVERSVSTLRAGLVAFAGAAVFRSIIQTSVSFQKLQASLKTVTGSAQAAKTAFAQIKQFAATTPFSVEEATEAFIKLKALGLDPSMDALKSYGNTASAMGKSLSQFIEAVADASTNEFERLKEFGIKASQEGDRVTFTFQGVATTVRKNSEEIQDYLRKIGEVQFAGAMDEQSKTLGGALSNLGDASQTFANEIGEGGLSSAVADFARQMADSAGGAQNLARTLGAALGAAVRGVAAVFKVASDNARGLVSIITGLIALKAATMFLTLAGAVLTFSRAMIAAAKAGVLVDAILSRTILGAIAKLIVVVGAGALAWHALGDEANAAIAEVENAIASVSRSASDGAAGEMGKETKKQLKDMVSDIEAAQRALYDYAVSNSTAARQAMEPFTEHMNNLNAAIRSGILSTQDRARAQAILTQAMEVSREAAARAQAEVDKEGNAIVGQIAALHQEAEAYRTGIKAHEELIAARERAADATAFEAALVEQVKAGYDLQGQSVAQLVERYREAREALDTTAEGARQNAEAMQYFEQAGERAVDRIGSGLTDMFLRGEDAALTFKNTAMAVFSELLQEMFRLSTINPLKNMLFGQDNPTLSNLGGILGGLLGGGGGMSPLPGPSGAPGGVLGGGFAMGGRPPVGVPSLVGERGMELFVPDVPGTIVPNHKLAGAMAGGGSQHVALTVSLSGDLDARMTSTAENVSLRTIRRESPKIVQDSVAATYRANSEVPLR